MYINNSDKFEKLLNKVADSGIVKRCIKSHHQGIYQDRGELNLNNLSEDQNKIWALLTSLADNYQSKERVASDKSGYKSNKTLDSIFKKITLSNEINKTSDSDNFDHTELSYSNLDQLLPTEKEEVGKSYQDFLDKFQDDFEDITNFLFERNKKFSAVLSTYKRLIEKYLWTIPANTQEGHSDISLAEHLTLTSVISGSLYDYLVEQELSLENYSKVEKFLEEKEELKSLKLLVGDFSGIQNYIFNISNSKTATKRLKGRSLNVQLISEDIRKYIIDELGLNLVNIIISAGGKFVILAPNTDFIEDKFEQIKQDIEQRIFEKFRGEIVFNLAHSQGIPGEDLNNLGKYLDDTFAKLVEAKYNPFSKLIQRESGWQEGFFLQDRNNRTDEKVCKLCEKYLTEVKSRGKNWKLENIEKVCRNCAHDLDLGLSLNHGINFFLWKNKNQKTDSKEISLLFHNVKVVTDNEVCGDISDIKYSTFVNPDFEKNSDSHDKIKQLSLSGTKGIEQKFLALHVPSAKDGSTKSLEEIAESSRDQGADKLAIFKGDVDSLGNIFQAGLRRFGADSNRDRYSSARIKTLSSFMDMFFAGHFNKIISDKFENCYVVYSGGDDFVVIGHWLDIIDFAFLIRDNFAEFVSENSDVTFSAAIKLFNPKTPVFSEINRSESLLEQAKNFSKSKNNLNIFQKVIGWNQVKEIIKNKAEYFQDEFIRQGLVSSGNLRFLHNLSEIIQSNIEIQEKGESVIEGQTIEMWQPKLTYYLERNFDHSNQAKKWLEKNLLEKGLDDSFVKNLNIFTTYLIYLNRNN